MSFAQKLKTTREGLGLTQAEAAPLLDVSPSWIDKAERTQRTPHVLMQEGALARLRAATPRRKRSGQNTESSHPAEAETSLAPKLV